VSKSFSADARSDGANVISFFLSREVGERNEAVNVFHSLAYQLATIIPTARAAILAALVENERLVDNALEERVRKLLVEPLQSIPPQQTPLVFVIDALDECNHSDIRIMQQAFSALLLGVCALSGSVRV
jgi:hypothetical protein